MQRQKRLLSDIDFVYGDAQSANVVIHNVRDRYNSVEYEEALL